MARYEFRAHVAVEADSPSDAATSIDGLLEHAREAAELSRSTQSFSIELDEGSPAVIEEER